MARNVIVGKSVAVTGLKELQAKLRDLRAAIDPKDRAALARATGMNMMDVTSEATDYLYGQVTKNARSANVPRDAQKDIFTWKKPHPRDSARDRVTALVGIRKRGRLIGSKSLMQTSGKVHKYAGYGYREWNPGRSWQSVPGAYLKKKKAFQKGFVSGRIIGESLATMWELGTSRMGARPFFGPAVAASRASIASLYATRIRQILQRFAA